MSEHAKHANETLGSKNWTRVAAYRGIVYNMLLNYIEVFLN
jgi:hypothetical protein